MPFVVSFASTLDESAAHADLILPASTFLEIWGDDFMEGTGYAGVSLRRPVVEPVHDTRNPGDVLLELAARLGGPLAQALPWPDYQELVDCSPGRPRHRARQAGRRTASGPRWFTSTPQPGSPAWSDVVGRDRLNAPQDGRFDFFSRVSSCRRCSAADSDLTPACRTSSCPGPGTTSDAKRSTTPSCWSPRR